MMLSWVWGRWSKAALVHWVLLLAATSGTTASLSSQEFCSSTTETKVSSDSGTPATMSLLLDVEVYSPEPLGKRHLFLAGTKLAAILDPARQPWECLIQTMPNIKVFEMEGLIAAPGIIDIHEHIIGGGGEAGPSSRTPEARVSDLVHAGVTTAVGVLGTDCVGRSLESLRSKVAALREVGLTAFMWVGCYRVPSPTLTGSLLRDLQLVQEVVGAGEIAISDHRGSWPGVAELVQLVTDARVGGMLSGKKGVVHFHVGSATSLLDPLWAILNATHGALPMDHILPTHVSSRGPALLKAAGDWMDRGGHVDFTADSEGEKQTVAALLEWERLGRFGGPNRGSSGTGRVSISSDGFGSLPKFDASGRLVGYTSASPSSLLRTLQTLVLEHNWPLQRTLPLATSNPASFLSLSNKGYLAEGYDADVMLLTRDTMELRYLFANGRLMMAPHDVAWKCQ